MSEFLYAYSTPRIIRFKPIFETGYVPEEFKTTFAEAKESKILNLEREIERIRRCVEQVKGISENDCLTINDPFR